MKNHYQSLKGINHSEPETTFRYISIAEIFHAVDEIPQESLREFMGEFWVPVAKMASNLPEARFVKDARRDVGRSSGYPLLMFLVDYSGSLGDSDIDCVDCLKERGISGVLAGPLAHIARVPVDGLQR